MTESMSQKAARVQKFRPLDDVFFEVLIQSIKVCTEMLRTILNDPNLTVTGVIPQNSIRNLQGRSVRLDCLCRLGGGQFCNVEVQRADDDDHFRRARYNASCITANVTDPGQKFKNVPDVIIVYITEHDFLKRGKTIYHICNVVYESGDIIDDGLKEIFVNTEIDDGSDVAALMKCFKEQEPSNPKFPELKQAVFNIKHTEGGISSMCEVMEQYAKEYAREEAIKSTVKTCKRYNDTSENTTKIIMEQFELSHDDAAQKVAQYWND